MPKSQETTALSFPEPISPKSYLQIYFGCRFISMDRVMNSLVYEHSKR